MSKVAELLPAAAVFEICRRMTRHRLNVRKNTAPVMSAVMTNVGRLIPIYEKSLGVR